VALTLASTITLNDGTEMPRMGLGVYQIPDGGPTEHAVASALAAGYRHLDTAKIYRNEVSVGRAIRASGVPREDIWVTTKLWPLDALQVGSACDKSLRRLGLDYVDLYLVHFPIPGLVARTWRAMEAVATSGRARSIGVSNFNATRLARLANADVPPSVNQVKASVFGYRRDVYDRCIAQHVAFEAYSPLHRGKQLGDATVIGIAASHVKSPAQVLLRWALQKDMVVIPKSSNEARIVENADVFDFELTDAEMVQLDALSR
jgi:diketogulonate reductase-like aldo/keto reductase